MIAAFLEQHSKNSMMRLNQLIVAIGTGVFILAVSFYIIVKAFSIEGVQDWWGLGAFALGLLAGNGVVAFAKAAQKKHEINGSG